MSLTYFFLIFVLVFFVVIFLIIYFKTVKKKEIEIPSQSNEDPPARPELEEN